MKKITRKDIKDILAYEKAREAVRERIIKIKQARRIEIGPYVTVVFENRDTVIFQIQEMMRAERIVKDAAIKAEIDAYNPLIPEKNELSATLLIEITDQKRIKPILDKLMGLDKGRKLWIAFGDSKIYARFESGRSTEEKISAVQFIRFPFTAQQLRQFMANEDSATLVVEHPNYKHQGKIGPMTRGALLEDLK